MLPSSAPVVVVGVAPTFFFHVVTLAFSSDPLLNLPTPFKSLFVCLLWVWGGAISLVWSANVEFLGDKMRSQVGRDSDPRRVFQATVVCLGTQPASLSCLHGGPWAACAHSSSQGALLKPKLVTG